MGRNLRLTQTVIPNPSEEVSVVAFGDLRQASPFFLRFAYLLIVPSAQLRQFTIPGRLHIHAQNASTFRIGKCDGPFLPLPLVLPLILQDISHDEERHQSYDRKDRPTAPRTDIVEKTEEPSRENR